MAAQQQYQRVDRDAAARLLLARRREWIVARVDGRVVGAFIPSRSTPNKFHGVALDGYVCDCLDFTRRGVRCAHSLSLEYGVRQRRQQRMAQ